MLLHLRPDPVVPAAALEAGKKRLVVDSAFASLTGALSGGVVVVSFALALGAGPMLIGLLAAIPFLAQSMQLPAIALVERLRQRRRIAVIAVTAARTLIFGLAFVPFIGDATLRVPAFIGAQLAIAALGSFAGCAVNSWLHQLVPRDTLGAFFSRRLFWSTSMACIGTLGAGLLVDHLPVADRLYAYAVSFLLAGIAGYVSTAFLARVPEPAMRDAGPSVSMLDKLKAPLRDANFRRLLVFLASWNVASNVAAPFLTVYLLRQLGYGLSTVTGLWVTSQAANALTLYLWGRLTDRLSNKAILATALPLYFACTLGLVFTNAADNPLVRLGLLAVVHVAMGAASGGIGLATGNLGLKLAPQGQGTAYLASVGFVSAIAGGVAPIAAGALAQWLESSQLSVLVRWSSASSSAEVAVFEFAHWEFLFALSAALGLYALHRLSRVSEGQDISERVVIQQFALETLRTVNQLSSVGGMLGSLFAFSRLTERRRATRDPEP